MTASRRSAHAIAVLKRVRQDNLDGDSARYHSRMMSFVEEWRHGAPRGTEAATAEALLMDGIGFACSACREAYAGNPTRIESRAQAGEAVVVRVLCHSCHHAQPMTQEQKRPWPWGRKS